MGNEWLPKKISHIARLVTEKISVEDVALEDYVSTDSMISEFGGIEAALKMPLTGKVTRFHKGDVLFSNIRPYFKKLWLADKDGGCSNDVLVFRPKNEIPSSYLYFLLMNDHFIQHTVVTSKGTKMPRGDKTAILDYEFSLAPQQTRSEIGDTLLTYTRKIELNKKINQTLEKMAQAMFKSWFVDFDPVFDNLLEKHNNNIEKASVYLTKKGAEDLVPKLQQRHKIQQTKDYKPLPDHIKKEFPNDFQHHEDIGWIPEGWQIKSFDSLVQLIGGGTPKTSIEEYWGGDIPWFSVVDAPNESDVFVSDTEKHITQKGIDNSSAPLLRKGTTIISARGTVGKCALVATPMAMNQSCYGLNGKKGVSDEFVYFLIRHQVSDLIKRGHGSVFNTITRETFKSIILAFCGSELTQKFSSYASLYLAKILLNNRQITALSNTRDSLIPALISGKVR